MFDPIDTREKINSACAAIRSSVKLNGARGSLEGDLQEAYHSLDEALMTIDSEAAHSRSAVTEAIDLLKTRQSELIAQDSGALQKARTLLTSINWD